MKKLNKKGFTLVELLAVIVILAVIMVITIPTVLGSMSGAKTKAFEAALQTIEEFGEKQLQLCSAGLGDLAGSYESTVVGKTSKGTCYLLAAGITEDGTTTAGTDNGKTNLVSKAGYTDITISDIEVSNGIVKIKSASAASTSEFGTQSYTAS